MEYKIISQIDQGSYATVYSASWMDQTVVLKQIALDQFQDWLTEEAVIEFNVKEGLRHSNLLPLHHCFAEGSNLNIIMPLIEYGSIGRILRHAYPSGIKNPALLASILYQVLLGLSYLHSNQETHKDLKCGNILVNYSGKILLTDYGPVTKVRDGLRNTSQKVSPCWTAPEVIAGECGQDWRSDIWSFGITALEMAQGKVLYSQYPVRKIMAMILEKDPPVLTRADQLDALFKDLVNMCLKKTPAERPTCQQLMRHEFFNMANDCEYIRGELIRDLRAVGEGSSDNIGYIGLGEIKNEWSSVGASRQPSRAQGEDPEDMNQYDVDE